MSMVEFNCELLELNFDVPNEVFTKDDFFEAIKADNRKKPTYVLSFGSKEKPGEQHGHIFVDFRGEGRVRLRLSYHNFGGDDADTDPPYMEDCGKWLAEFIKEEEVVTEIEAGFVFDESYSPVIALPFPLLTPDKDLAGSSVTGIRIKPPPRMRLKSVILQRWKTETDLHIYLKRKMRLRDFDLNLQLADLSTKAMKFVTRTGETQ